MAAAPDPGKSQEPEPPPQKAGTSSYQILQTGTVLLKGFIRDRVQSCGDSERIEATVTELKDSESQVCDPNTKRLSECLRRIGDELDGNLELQSFCNAIPYSLDAAVAADAMPDRPSFNMIEKVQLYPPKEVFFKVAAEMFSDGTFNWGRVVALFYFACKLVLKEGLLSYFGTPTWQTIAVFAAGVLTASLTFWKMS